MVKGFSDFEKVWIGLSLAGLSLPEILVFSPF